MAQPLRLTTLLAFTFTAPLLAAGTASGPAAERSTGQVESAVAPARVPIERLPVVSTTPVALAAGATSLLHEGKISRLGPQEVVLSPVPDGMLEIRVVAKSGDIWMSIFRDERTEADPGATAESRAVAWISSGDGARKLRIVAYCDCDETPFRVAVRATPPSDAPKPPPS